MSDDISNLVELSSFSGKIVINHQRCHFLNDSYDERDFFFIIIKSRVRNRQFGIPSKLEVNLPVQES